MNKALEACLALARAYQNGEDAGGEMDWEDVDLAYVMAKEALAEAGIPLPAPAVEGEQASADAALRKIGEDFGHLATFIPAPQKKDETP